MASPQTVVAPTAMGQVVEYIQKVESLQEDDLKNPDTANIIQNINFDFDTNTYAIAIAGTFTHSADAITGAITAVVDDPFID